MKHISYFEAFDGKQFDDEQECYEYELEQKAEKLTGDVILWNHSHNILPLSTAGYEEAMYVQVNTEEGAQYLEELAASVGLATPWGYGNAPRPGKWVYVEGEARHYDWLDFYDLEDFYNTCEIVFNSAPI